jgi:hypothetical protein
MRVSKLGELFVMVFVDWNLGQLLSVPWKKTYKDPCMRGVYNNGRHEI